LERGSFAIWRISDSGFGFGAEWLEGTFTSGFLISSFAPRWSADGIKLFGWATLVISTVLFALGLFSPGGRALKFS